MARSSTKELVVESKEEAVENKEEAVALNSQALNVPSSRLHHTRNVLQLLKSLKLEMLMNEDVYLGNFKGWKDYLSPIAWVLSNASNLRYLEFVTIATGLGEKEPGDFDSMMLGCVLPNLETCKFVCWVFDSMHLLDFLGGSPDLVHLSFDDSEFLDDDVTAAVVLQYLQQTRPSLEVVFCGK
ncbi:MAG: hypothetical protein Q9213_000983 [Squamulea squamosa]